MIGTYPVAVLAPLDYRYALDAAMPMLAEAHRPAVVCNVPELMPEVRQRIPDWGDLDNAPAALWVEPLVGSWQSDLETLTDALSHGGLLVIVASGPLARTVPERRSWSTLPLGHRPGGIGRVRRALAESGFRLESSHGFHSPIAIGLGLLSRLAERSGRPELGDRLHFAARLRYCTRGPLTMLSTVRLLTARKERC